MIRTIQFRLLCIFLILLFNGCSYMLRGNKGEEAERVGVTRSIFAPSPPISPLLAQHVSEKGELHLAQSEFADLINRPSWSLGDVVIHWKKGDDPPKPIPGRLLVEINPSELKDSFRREKPNFNPGPLIHQGLLPADLKIAKVRYYAQLMDQRIALAITLEKPMDTDKLRKLFRKHAALSPKLKLDVIIKEKSDNFLLILDNRYFNFMWGKVSAPDYVYLKEYSIIRGEFKKLGILSMQRVLRSTEIPDPNNPGFFRVRNFRDLLAQVKDNFPKRTARAYPCVSVPDNLENWFILQLEPNAKLDQAIETLSRLEGLVLRVSADYPVLAATNDPEYPDQWALNNTGSFQSEPPVTPGFDINVEPAWSAAPTSRSIVVAVLDTGFKEDLDELENRLWTNPDETLEDGQDNDCNGYIDDIHGITTYDRWEVDYSALPACSVSPGLASQPLGTHGTRIAGVIAAEAENNIGIAGVAGTDPVQLMNIAVGWCSPQATFGNGSAELAEGLWYALEKGADIANMSVTTRGLPFFLQGMVHASLDAGMILVGSAGNDAERFTKAEGYSSFGVFPAGIKGVISVGGSMRNGLWWPQSNYGPGLDLVAPASEVRTLSYDSNNPLQTVADIVTVEGTSLSAAFTSGAASVILGRYPEITAPYMRQWLRATARDITDPQGLGANFPGDDEWTGAGMLDLGTATIALADPQDQPLNVDILVERLSLGPPQHFSDLAPDAVGGSPDLGITVMAPSCQPGVLPQPVSCALASWRLEYGVGDVPGVWSQITIPDPNPATPEHETIISPVDVERTGSSYYRHTKVASGYNYLDTDLLQNQQLYTVRLVAENKASRQFTAYDWIIPLRAKITNPTHNETIHSRWGWPGMDGFVDIRPNANYVVSLSDDGGNVLWSSIPFTPAEKYDALVAEHPSYQQLADNWGESASAWILGLIVEETDFPGWEPEYPDSDPQNMTEGWVDLSLHVQTETGASETDTVRQYLDTSHFPYKTNWPVATDHIVTYSGSPMSLLITDLGGSVGRRILAGRQRQIRCYDVNGASHWSALSVIAPVVGDVDNDGAKEILTVTTENFWPGMGRPGDDSIPTGGLNVLVHLWSPNSCADDDTQDGVLHNANWPVTFNFFPTDEDYWFAYTGTIENMAIADIAGDAAKEIIFYQRPNKYYSVPVADIRPGYLRVYDANGSELWSREFPPEQDKLPFKIDDTNNDGKSEILLESKGLILQGDNTFRIGWDTERNYDHGEFLTRAWGVKDIVLHKSKWSAPNYQVTLISWNGVVRSGWPISFSSNVSPDPIDPNSRPAKLRVLTGQVVAGGDEEIVLCENKISVYGVDGQRVNAIPEVDLMGSCQGLALLDVDDDSELEMVVLVHRFQLDVPPTLRRGAFIEAYELDGTRLGDSDDRWPIVVSTATFPAWNESIGVADIDEDGIYEFIQQLQNRPYKGAMYTPGPRHMIEILELN